MSSRPNHAYMDFPRKAYTPREVDEFRHVAAIVEHLLTERSQHQTASHTIEELDIEFLLEIVDLPRKGRLADAQTRRCPRYRAKFDDSDECAQAL